MVHSASRIFYVDQSSLDRPSSGRRFRPPSFLPPPSSRKVERISSMVFNLDALRAYQISNFFTRNVPATQEQCNLRAQETTGTPVHTTSLQGASSYTVLSSDETCVVQFRAGNSPLDMDLIGCIEKAYEEWTPRHEYVGDLGELHVYTMHNVGGASLYFTRDSLEEDDGRLMKETVKDFARFFASAWKKTPEHMSCPTRTSLLSSYTSELSQLQQCLPSRFRPTLDYLLSKLPSLLSDGWPLVPNHTDLVDNNIHVHQDGTGRLAGICDWKDTIIGPFGMSLHQLETMLGVYKYNTGWQYYSFQKELRELFWKTLYQSMGESVSDEQKELIEVARLVGLFLEFGAGWKDGRKGPAGEEFMGLGHLEAVTLTLWAQSGHEPRWFAWSR